MDFLYRGYGCLILAAQAAGCLLWWLLMATVPPVREAFSFPGVADATFDGLFLADAALYAGLAAAGAILLWRGSALGYLCLFLHCGAAAYATLMAAGFAFTSGGGMVGAVLMAIPTAAETAFAWIVGKDLLRDPD